MPYCSPLFFAAVAFACLTATSSASVSLHVHSTLSLEAIARVGWQPVGSPSPTSLLDKPVMVALTRANDDALTQLVWDVSNPSSKAYTNYPTMSHLSAMSTPQDRASAVVRVTQWMASAGVQFGPVGLGHSLKLAKDITVQQASELFSCQFYEVVNNITGQRSIVADSVRFPLAVAGDIEAVFGLTDLPLPPRRLVRRRATFLRGSAPNDGNVTPSVIAQTYNISGITPSGGTSNRQAVAEFQGQLLSKSDLATFFKDYVPHAKPGDDQVYKFVGDNQSGEGVEANLDIQYIMGTAPGIKTEAWQYAGQAFCADLKQWTQQIIGTTNPPNVFSVSYGWQNTLDSIGCTTQEAQSIEADFKTITATGVSIIFASGDSGSGYQSFFGLDPQLYSSWPANSFYVTAVGATTFIGSGPGEAGEQASSQFGSGGGFSRLNTPAPSYQASAISTFYSRETKAPSQKIYGYGGRGTPDVAALGENYQVIMGGIPEGVGGTSASTPTFSAMVSLVNEARFQKGKKPLGLLNPFLYANADVFYRDVTQGNNRIDRSGIPVPDGWDCEVGWDPVTGFGEVDFPTFLQKGVAQ